MLIPPKYKKTPKLDQLLQQIEVLKEIINTVVIPTEIEANIRRQSTLKSSLYSARIEGNPLTLTTLNNSQSQQKKEVFNILKAHNITRKNSTKKISTKQLLNLHKIVMSDLGGNPGKFRLEPGAIFNQADIVVYLPPRPSQIPILIDRLLNFINTDKKIPIPIKAALTHYTFEKIHPFLDGNGRVGRLIIQNVLSLDGYDMKGLISIEEYLDNHRNEYYAYLDNDENDVTEFLEFILEAIVKTASSVKELILQNDQKPEDYLLPRRAEILNIIRDQKLVNFDQIRRRFLSVNERTLRYDLKKLAETSLIKKLGTTKGVFYKIP